MADIVRKGQWVEIYRVILRPGERAPQVPDDTKQVPLEMRVKGFLEKDAAIGDEVAVTTAAGRTVEGKLAAVNPAYTHGFGEPIGELIGIGRQVRGIIAGHTDRKKG
jgi:2-amino-4-ketopentanoate thiolase alpha subunit